MKSLSLVSKYTIKRYRGYQTASNSSVTANHLQRQFDVRTKQQIIVADLTYIRVNRCWNDLCVLLNLSNRQAKLVMSALSQIKQLLSALHHSGRGKEFDNQLLDKCFDTFNIQCSLSKKGYPYDNAVAEATFKSIKTEFIKGEKFMTTGE
jgi:putative transposase